MSRRGERIRQLVELANRRADQAARRFGEHTRRQQQALTVKEELAKFRSLYGEQRSRPGQVMLAGALWNGHQFLSRIDQALQQQDTELDRQSQHGSMLRQQWLHAYQRVTALKLVASNIELTERQHQAKSEQNTADEMSSLRFGRSLYD